MAHQNRQKGRRREESSTAKKKMTSLLLKRVMGSAIASVSGRALPPRAKPPTKSQTRVGVVSSAKMQKTVAVVVERLVKHPRWKKYVKKRKKYKMHHEPNYPGNETNWLRPGDVVKMVSTRPKAKTVFWELHSSAGGLVKKARVFDSDVVNEKVRERKLEERAARKNAERGFAGGGFAKEEEEEE